MITYVKKAKKNPISKEVKYYAQISATQPLTVEEIIDSIQQENTLTEVDIRACLVAFKQAVIKGLRDGRSVRLEGLGSFRPTISAMGCPAREMVTARTIKAIHVRFTPSSQIKAGVSLTNPLVKIQEEEIPVESSDAA